MSWDDVRRAEQSILAELVSRVTETTRAEIGQALVDGLASGDSIAELSIRLQRVTALGPSRAVTIARTETTRAVSSGSVEAMASAARLGVVVRKQWLSARDSAVRDDHRELDGQEAEVGGSFGSNGHHAAAPGGFGVAELDINCRCTVVPIVEET
jgi:SPP1 gp7 family putative phage head morphogenesis protein